MKIWKLSHGTADFTAEERQEFLDAHLAVMHRDTGKRQGEAFQNAAVNTVFYLCHGNESIELLGQFTSQAEPNRKGAGWLQRTYRILKRGNQAGGYNGQKFGWSPNYNSTFMEVKDDGLDSFESKLLRPYFNMDLKELAALADQGIDQPLQGYSARQMQDSQSDSRLESCVNRIYYGPPGTGKTYTVARLLESEYEQRVSTLPLEQWRQQFIAENIAGLMWWEGLVAALYDLGGTAKVRQLTDHPFIKAIARKKGRTGNIQDTIWTILSERAVLDSETVNMKQRFSPAVFDKSTDAVWRFAGDWREACADILAQVDTLQKGPQENGIVKRYTFVTFHQSYGYEEFVEGLRPVLMDEAQEGDVQYEIRPGAFKELCDKARQSPEKRFAIVIDEINRGNISKIFGELITLIEPDKRDPLNGDGPLFEVTLAYSGERFSVPANVDVYGTMNTADRSLALLDMALRRRFEFSPLLPDPDLLRDIEVHTEAGQINLPRMLSRINQRIEALYDRDHCIGHAYFMRLAAVPSAQRFRELQIIFRKRIVPLLEEYFFEDWQKIRLVLGDNQKQAEAHQFIRESLNHDEQLTHLFGSDVDFDEYAITHRYDVQDSAFAEPRAYIGIYQTITPE